MYVLLEWLSVFKIYEVELCFNERHVCGRVYTCAYVNARASVCVYVFVEDIEEWFCIFS
jgi:hypothetical protein